MRKAWVLALSALVSVGCGGGKHGDGDGGANDCPVGSGGNCPPAPPLDRTVITTMAEAAQFLYTGPNAMQKGVTPKALNPKHIAIVRGKVSDASGEPVVGVKISILGHAELGWTLTRADGVFDMAVNGGGQLVFAYAKDGFVPSQRTLSPRWQRYMNAPEVGLIELSTKASTVSTDASSQQVASAEPTTDAQGTRQPFVLFAPGTTAKAQLPDGSSQALSTLSVHITEYPLDLKPNTPARTQRFAPGSLPGSGNVNYTLEFTIDEAEALGATSVAFSKPATIYVENFLGLKAGSPVPIGNYDRGSSHWDTGTTGGLVVKIVDETGGQAALDIDGDGKADGGKALTELGVTDEELSELAARYKVGQSLSRTRVGHFSTWNYLFPVGASADAVKPDAPPTIRPIDDPSVRGSVLIEKQAVAQTVAIPGTPFALHYQTDRTSRLKSAFEVNVPLIGNTIPKGLKRVFSYVSIAGQEFDQTFPAKKSQTQVVDWDGKDAFGRTMQGKQVAQVSIGYVFDASVTASSVFGVPGLRLAFQDPENGKLETIIWQDFELPVGTFDASAFELGGFALDALHAYDPSTQTIYFGNGLDRSAQNVALGISRFGQDSDLGTPVSTFAAADGTVLVSDNQAGDSQASGHIFSVAPDETVTTIAGPGAAGAAGKLKLGSPRGVVMDSSGNVVFTDYLKDAVRSIASDGSVQTLVGALAADNPVVQADLKALDGLAFGSRGELYIANGDQVMVLEAGQLTTFAGGGTADADEVPATQALLIGASGIAVGTDGTVFISERGVRPPTPLDDPPPGGHRVRKITPDGLIHTLAGTGQPGFSGDGLDSAKAQLSGPRALSLGQDGSLYVADALNKRIRRITPDGIIETVVGGGDKDLGSNDAGLSNAQLAQKILLTDATGVSVASDGTVFVATPTSLYRAAAGLPQGDSKDNVVPSTDGLTLFRFDARGKQQETLDAVTGVSLLQFQYDPAGLLKSITDSNTLTTNFKRDSAGHLQTIVAPFQQTTTVTVDAQDRITTVTNPFDQANNRQLAFQYDDTKLGLMSTALDANGKPTVFGYDKGGGVNAVTDPTGFTETFKATPGFRSATFDVTTGAGRTTRYTNSAAGSAIRRDVRAPDSSHIQWDDAFVSQPIKMSDGTQVLNEFKADRFFGAQVLEPERTTVTTPGGRTLITTSDQAVVYADDKNALSANRWDLTEQTNERKFTTSYSRKTRTRTTTSPEGRTTTTTFDAQGRPTDLAAAGSPAVHFNYDSSGRVLSVTRTADKQTRTETYSYDPADGFMDTAVDAVGDTTNYNRDLLGRLADLTRPDQSKIFWTLDNDSHVTGITPPGRSPYQFQYKNNTDLLETSTPPGVSSGEKGAAGSPLGETGYAYGADNELIGVARSDGNNIKLDHDKLNGRLKGITLAGSGVGITFGYDSYGTLSSVNRSDSARVDITRDGSLWTGTSWSGAITGKVTADYDKNFWLASLTVNDASTVNFSYDNDGLITQAAGSGSTFTINRAPDSGLVSDTALGTVTTNVAYNGFGEVSALSANFQNQAGFSQTFRRDSLGRITRVSETIGTANHRTDYVYDNLGRLTQVTRDGSVTAYGYDPTGNRTSITVDGTQTVAATFDEQERILTHGSATYEATKTGDLFRKIDGSRSLELSYDELGNVLTANVADGKKTTAVSYVVDGTGRRIARKLGGKFDRAFLYRDQLRPVAEIDSDGTFSHFVYSSAEGAPDFILRDGVAFRIVKDYVGSVRLVVNAKTGVIAQRLDYDEFGVVLSDSDPGFQPFGFAGGLYDPATGLERFGARDYDAETGRWVAKDPSGFAGGVNMYAYCNGDPINLRDLTGLDPTPPNGDLGPLLELNASKSRYVLSKEGAKYMQATFKNFGFDVSKVTFSFRSQGPAGITIGNRVFLEKDYWSRISERQQLELLGHEVTHSVQYERLGKVKFLGRYFDAEYWRPDNYNARLAELWITPLSKLDVVDSLFTLDQLAERVGIETAGQLP